MQHAGRGSDLVGCARWWADSRSQLEQAAAQQQQQQQQQHAEQAATQQQADAAAARATGEVQAAAHATAVQAASAAESEAGSCSRAQRGAASEQPQPPQQTQQGAAPSWHWQAAGRWAERVSSELRAAVGQVEKLERDHQHEAAVARLHEVLETYTDVTRFPK
jgi:uncharacterized membrane protein